MKMWPWRVSPPALTGSVRRGEPENKKKYGNYSELALLKDEIRVTCDRIFDSFVSIVSLFMCRAYVGHDF